MADDNLHELGPTPSDIEALIERYLGSRSITAAQADVLLNELSAGRAPLVAPSTPPSISASALAAAAAPREYQRERRRYNTPFPQGIAGADDMPELYPVRGLRTPLPGFHPAAKQTPAGAGFTPAPNVFSPPSASAAWLPAPEESAVLPVARTPVPAALTPVPAAFPAATEPPPAAASSQPMAAAEDSSKEDSFEILVDDEMLELEADDLLIEEVGEDEA